MRIITLEANGNSPAHRHDWPHINYVISGQGTLMIADKEYTIGAGDCAYVPSKFICNLCANLRPTELFPVPMKPTRIMFFFTLLTSQNAILYEK